MTKTLFSFLCTELWLPCLHLMQPPTPPRDMVQTAADTNLQWEQGAGCALGSMAQLRGEQVNAKGGPNSPRLSTRQNGRNGGKVWERTFRPSVPPQVPPSSPAGSFLNQLLLFSHKQALSAFAPISLSLWVSNFLTQGWSANTKPSVWVQKDVIVCWALQAGQPPLLHFTWTVPGTDTAFLVHVLRKEQKPRIHLRTCPYYTTGEKTPLGSELTFNCTRKPPHHWFICFSPDII